MSIDSNTTITKIVCNHVRREEKCRREFRFAIKNMKDTHTQRERERETISDGSLAGAPGKETR